ncbi:hypothetical protein PVAP13_5KG514700 [Panicum virgatum]|uniref:Uncharacterized protein n=1 Tax=Panicum virgatum TaxID=38727 RepID=A0A8T0SUP1_PANVG|nr:hypothetical protein PVAP13_5KG514700 [Panicum virgatum]
MVESLVCLSAKSDRSFARPKEKWRPPIDGRVKVNTGGAFVEGARHGSGASVIRDHRGFVRAAQARWLGTVGDGGSYCDSGWVSARSRDGVPTCHPGVRLLGVGGRLEDNND